MRSLDYFFVEIFIESFFRLFDERFYSEDLKKASL